MNAVFPTHPFTQAVARFIAEGQRLLRPLPTETRLPDSADDAAVAGIEARPWTARSVPLGTLLAYVCLAGAAYGVVLGAFPGLHGPRPLQMLYSAIKVPLLLLVSFGLTLPSFFVLNTLLGLRNDFPAALRALLSAQAALALVLAALAPLTATWYLSVTSYPSCTFFNGVMFAIATFSARWPLRRRYAPLIARNPRHRSMLTIWLVLYVFVAIQMAWVLRPFLGDPAQATTFFRHGAWGNAYMVVLEVIRRTFGW